MSNPVNKVLYNVDQTADTTEAQKAQARANIGAQGQLTAGSNVTIDANNVISAAGFTGVSATAPIYGNGTAGDPLVLRTSHGLSLVQNSEDSTTSLQVTHPVPPPGSTSTNKVLTCVDALENLEWRNIPESTSEVFLAEYGVATVTEISAAKNAGKEVFTLIPGTYYSTVAYLREVTRNGASANFASVVSNDSNVKTASVDSSGNWSNSTVNLASVSDSSLIQKLNYGDLTPSRVGTLLIDSDDPEGYAQVKADNVTKGHLVIGPYKDLLDSGINGGSGIGDGDTPVYIDSNGTFKTCNPYPAGVFIAYWSGYGTGHGNTTYAAIKAAYDAGKAVFMYNTISGGDVWRTLDTIDSNRAIFSRTSGAVTGGNFGNVVSSIVYVESYDDSYHYMDCPLQPELTAGYRIEIVPGANDTVRVNNTMHESVINTCLSWDTLANNYDFDYFWGNWRCHVHLKAFSDWTQDDGAIHIRIEHVYKSEAAQKIKCGSYQVQNFYPYQSGNTYDFANSHWYYNGTDPYTTATNPDPYGFKFHLNATTPTRQMPTDQKAHRFIVDTGAPYGEWLELDASVRFMVPNAAPSGNGIYLLLKGKYAYNYN